VYRTTAHDLPYALAWINEAPGAVLFAGVVCAGAAYCAEIGQPFALQLVSTDAGQTRSPEFRRINPKGRIPVLVTGDRVLTEAPAILLQLALTHPSAHLLPGGADGLVRALEWFNWLSGTVHAVAVRMIWRPEQFTATPLTADSAERAAIVAKGHEQLAAAFTLINERLSVAEWAVGPHYSIVDAYLLVFYRWGNRMALPMRELYPAWTAHTLSIIDRPAVQRALTSEGISVWQ
jgi:glutathione S-transferase